MKTKVHFRSGFGNKDYPACGVAPGRVLTDEAASVTCLSCVRRMRKDGVAGTPPLAVKPSGRRPRGRAVHAVECDMDEYCSCGAGPG